MQVFDRFCELKEITRSGVVFLVDGCACSPDAAGGAARFCVFVCTERLKHRPRGRSNKINGEHTVRSIADRYAAGEALVAFDCNVHQVSARCFLLRTLERETARVPDSA